MTARSHHDRDASLDPLKTRSPSMKAHPIEEVGKRPRDMMGWIREARKDSSDPGSG